MQVRLVGRGGLSERLDLGNFSIYLLNNPFELKLYPQDVSRNLYPTKTGSYVVEADWVSSDGTEKTINASSAVFSIIPAGTSTTTPTVNFPPSISGVSGPTTLSVGQSGTWTVQASDPENGSLSYSVVWGDEGLMASGSYSPTAAAVQQSATFTHTYSSSGTFSPTFTATDNSGQYGKTSISVNVGGGGNGCENGSMYNYLTGALCPTVGIDLAVTSFELNGDGPRALFCNNGSTQLNNFPLEIWINDVTRNFDLAGVLSPGSCQTHQWYYATWGLASGSSYFGVVSVDPYGTYAEINETNNKVRADYNGGGINPTTVQVLSPNGGETLTKGQVYRIKWESSNLSSVYIKLRKNSVGDTVLGITNTIPNLGYYDWAVPTSLSDGNDYVIKVVGGSPSSPTVSDDSNSPFSVVSPPLQPAPIIISSNPPNGAIDARQDKSTAASASGWKEIMLTFSGPVLKGPLDYYAVSSSNISGAPGIATAGTCSADPNQICLSLTRALIPGERIRIINKLSSSSVCLGYLPGDVDQSAMVAPADILEMVDIMNGVKKVPLYIGDIDRNGLIAPADQLAFTNILNATNGQRLPACPAL